MHSLAVYVKEDLPWDWVGLILKKPFGLNSNLAY